MEYRAEEITRLLDNVDRLAQLAEGNERRMRRLERWNRSLAGSLLALIGLSLYLGFTLSGPPAVAAEGEMERLEEHAAAEARKLELDAKTEAQHIATQVAGIKHELASGKFDPGRAIFAMLHEIQNALQAVPRMADDMDQMTRAMNEMNQKMSAMPAMAVDMHDMNGKMGMMAYDVNRTMGKMGSWMPIPWGP